MEIVSEILAIALLVLATGLFAAAFTATTTMISKLMKEMQKGHCQMAVVRDPAGNVVGLITLEDILEEIVGEIE